MKFPGQLHWIWLSALVFVLDQWTKVIAVNTLVLYERVPVLPFFNFTLAYNYGAAWSFLADAGGWQRWFFIAIAAVVSVVLVIWMARASKAETLLGVAFALILGGALGNVWDRATLGYVVDFLDFYWNQSHFPAFNIADSAITVGAGLLILDMFMHKQADSA